MPANQKRTLYRHDGIMQSASRLLPNVVCAALHVFYMSVSSPHLALVSMLPSKSLNQNLLHAKSAFHYLICCNRLFHLK